MTVWSGKDEKCTKEERGVIPQTKELFVGQWLFRSKSPQPFCCSATSEIDRNFGLRPSHNTCDTALTVSEIALASRLLDDDEN